MTQKKSDGFREIAKTVGYAILIALVIRTFLFEPFRIPSGSMIPSLLIGDYLFVAKYSYGYSKYSLPLSPDLFSGRIMESTPKRGDVVVFVPPPHPDLDYIKRIIGLPGDHIQMKEGILYINDVAVVRDKIDDYVDEQGNHYTQYIETLPNGVKHHIIEEQGDNGSLDNTDVFVVPPGHYFAMGDNRDNSGGQPNVGSAAMCRRKTSSARQRSSSFRPTVPPIGGKSGNGRSPCAIRGCSI